MIIPNLIISGPVYAMIIPFSYFGAWLHHEYPKFSYFGSWQRQALGCAIIIPFFYFGSWHGCIMIIPKFSDFGSWLHQDPPLSQISLWLHHNYLKFSDFGSWMQYEYPKFYYSRS
jgi:hypothetical protein